MKEFDNISSLHSVSYKDSNFVEMQSSKYRIIDKETEACITTYTKLQRNLDTHLREVNLILLDDTKSKVRLITFYLINNLILIIFLSVIYLSFTERFSLKLKINKN